MGAKSKLKKVIANLVYGMYGHHILKEDINVCSIDETIDELLSSSKSLVRFGDGEIALIMRKSSATQTDSADLAQRLKDVLKSDDEELMVALPDIFSGVKQYRKSTQQFWKEHILTARKTYHKYCDSRKKYYNAYFSRNYYAYTDRTACAGQNERIKSIWAGKDVIIVEGAATHNGVGNDLLDRAKSVSRIIGPSTDAYGKYDEILKACLETAEAKDGKDLIFLISLGAAAKPLTYDLHKSGYRVLDIGNLDLEYEWFLRNIEEKTVLSKHSIVGEDANRKAGYTGYLDQIVIYI